MIIKDKVRLKSKIFMGLLFLTFIGLAVQNILNDGKRELLIVFSFMTLLTGIGATYASSVKVSKRLRLITLRRKLFGFEFSKSEYKTSSFQGIVLMSTLNLDSRKVFYEMFLVGDAAFDLWNEKHEQFKNTNSYSKSSNDNRGLLIKCNIEHSDLAEEGALAVKLSKMIGLEYFNFTRV
ncbi:hypothetical protein A9Q84_17955 [Halobacteriovorax marinus]|uniref:Uncharacterized protein n=1 Tax=Halobacteriovorax marinus TaxID=97084 RepID=A0A1Y5F8S4_9BACT|nr:hypothetical protein A9Q84_17955 [Halobacteriovorax marinus]